MFGSFVGIYVGRYFGPISNVTLITEFTTTFVNIRWLLYFHGKTSSKAYLYNGYVMTASFFVVRVLFMTYLILMVGFLGAIKEVDLSKDPQGILLLGRCSLAAFLVLLVLNYVWFRKMILGALKYMNKAKT